MLIRTLFSRELLALGVRELRAHKLRSILTSLGMIFGVGAVICMLSIGEGASREELESIRLLGSENIIVRSVEPPTAQQSRARSASLSQYGITESDVERLRALPDVADLVLMHDVADIITNGARKYEGVVVGTTENFFDVIHVPVARGRPLAASDSRDSRKVCVIGDHAAKHLFPAEDPLGRLIAVATPATKTVPYEIVGVLAESLTAGSPAKGVGMRNVNRDVYIPYQTASQRYGELRVKVGRGNREVRKVHLSDLYVRASDTDAVLGLSQLIKRVFQHGHKEPDYEIKVPLELLQTAQEAKRRWQLVLGSIAGISLVVGGIGIMNIMLASVTERTREIGIRRALGAKRHHITAQFLLETLILSVGGGVFGIVAGIVFAFVVTRYAGWETIIPMWGVALSFCVSALVGVSFGLYPAQAAARLDPIEALRYE